MSGRRRLERFCFWRSHAFVFVRSVASETVFGALLVALASGVACTPTAPHRNAAVADPVLRMNTPRVLIVVPDAAFEQTVLTLKGELADEIDVLVRYTTDTTQPERLASWIDEIGPSALILLDNSVARLFAKLQRQKPKQSFPPAVLLMVTYLRDVYLSRLTGATGINYEVPAQTTFVRLRSVADTNTRKVGVVIRETLTPILSRESELLGREGIALVPAVVSSSPTKNELANALNSLIEEQEIDALWVLNDNVLLSSKLISSVWLKYTRRESLTVVVGVQALLGGKARLGDIAVTPDHVGLAVQAADMVLSIQDENWSLENVPVQDPISVKVTSEKDFE